MPASADRVSLLGTFRLSRRDADIVLPEGAQRLIAFLALTSDHGATRRAVTGALWPEASESRARAALRSTLWRIRRVVPGLVRNDGQRMSLDPAVVVDATELDTAIRHAMDAPAEASDADLVALTHAEELLSDWDDGWIVVERERMRQVRLEALESLAEDLTDRGLVGHAVEAGLAAVAEEPYRESAHRVLIEAYVRKGNAAAAFDQFRRLRTTLRRELGVSPSAELVARIRRLRRDRVPRDGQGGPGG
jgi:DNA-binding SARP family transcriptional activator